MLYLHIGTSKAGSTTIQHYLHDADTAAFGLGQLTCFGRGNATRLAAAANTRNARNYWIHGRKYMTRAAFEANCHAVWEELAPEMAQSGCTNFVVSSEYLYRHFYGAPRGLEAFRNRLLGHFGDVRVILYLRDQRAWLRSFYAQTVMGTERSTRSYAEFLEQSRNRPARWNYRAGVRLWARVFGRDNLVVVPFDTANFVKGNLIADFLSRISPELAQRYEPAAYDAAQNISPHLAEIEAIRRLNALPMSESALSTRGLRFLAQRSAERLAPTTTTADAHDVEILDMVTEGNDWLNKRYFKDAPVKLPVSPTCAPMARA